MAKVNVLDNYGSMDEFWKEFDKAYDSAHDDAVEYIKNRKDWDKLPAEAVLLATTSVIFDYMLFAFEGNIDVFSRVISSCVKENLTEEQIDSLIISLAKLKTKE